MRVEWLIAWRYLFAKKKHNAINIVSAVSAAGVCVATAALVCVLSVMNGFGSLIQDMFSSFDPELKIVPFEGKTFHTNAPELQPLYQLPSINLISETIEETALVIYGEKQTPAYIKGVDSLFQKLTQIDSILVDGSFVVDKGGFNRCVMGRGLAGQIGIGAHFVSGMKLYAPKRYKRVNMLNPEESFNRASVFISGIFAVNQVKYDDKYMLVSLPLARNLFDYADDEVSALELKVSSSSKVQKAKKEIQGLIGNNYKVLDQYEQQADFFRILNIEKMLTTLLLVFILLIATFNIIGSLSMLMIDKHADIEVLRCLGVTSHTIRQTFLLEGWLISVLGALIGLSLGILLCLLQQEFGFIHLGNGEDYVISAYPVQVQAGDIALVACVVLLLGFVAAWYPTRHLAKSYDSNAN